jgi:pilus assembly protein Flp/PilA
MLTFVGTILRDKTGATAIEYGLIAALISVAIIAAITLLGTSVSATFDHIGDAIRNAMRGG